MICQFRGEYYFLSNLYPCHLQYDDMDFLSLEHAYLYLKYNNNDFRYKCLSDIPANILKKSTTGLTLTKDWNSIKIHTMYELLKIKFNNEPYKSLLLDTSNQNIVEGNNWNDTFWGVDINTTPNYGENHLGRLIMKVRDELNGINKKKISIF